MPGHTFDVSTKTYKSALAVPSTVMDALAQDPRSNIVLAKLQTYRSEETNGIRIAGKDEFWIVCTSVRERKPVVHFVLSCTFGITGKYPIFIYSVKHELELSRNIIDICMHAIAKELLTSVSTSRVYSVFAARQVAESFVDHWHTNTGIHSIAGPYYAAKFSLCTPLTFSEKDEPRFDASVDMRPARRCDLEGVAQLCKGFAQESEPFVLDTIGAMKEAKTLVAKGQVWVLTVPYSSGPGLAVACICATTRTANNVTAITKVYTPPQFRQRGYAHKLVRHVCRHLFNESRRDFIVLYVGNDNSAASVYAKVGFVGLDGADHQDPNVENWVEIGFDRSKVDLGHW